MENIYNIGEEVDFTKANFTAIVSDLHLCEAEPVDPDFPLWKKPETFQRTIGGVGCGHF